MKTPASIQSIHGWRCPVPGDFNCRPVPMLCVDAATEADYAASHDDCAHLHTFIWYRTRRGREAARRIARQLATTGLAVVYPRDPPLTIHIGERHRVVFLSGIEVWH